MSVYIQYTECILNLSIYLLNIACFLLVFMTYSLYFVGSNTSLLKLREIPTITTLT